MAMGGPAVKIGGIYAKSLDTFNLSQPRANYKPSDGQINFQKIQARHGPYALHAHIMRAAFDPVYGREMSIAQQEEKPATRFPLAETTRPNERSENVNLFALLGGSYIKPNKVNPFQNTITFYDVRGQGKKGEEGPYQAYGGKYSGNYRRKDDDPTNKNPLKVKLNPYENRIGIGTKVTYLGQKLKGYIGKVTGYDSKSEYQGQVSTYEGQNPLVSTYILPTGYSGTAPQTSIDAHIAEHENIVPQNVLDATIKDAERFLEEQRRKNRLSFVDNESELELALSKIIT